MATVMKAAFTFARRIGSTSNDRDSINRVDGYSRAHTLPVHLHPLGSTDQTAGRASVSNNAINGRTSGLSSPTVESSAELHEISENQSQAAGIDIASNHSANSQTQAAEKSAEQLANEQLEAERYSNAEFKKCQKKYAKDYVRGISRLAAFQASSDHLAIFRRFKTGNTRILVRLELEITELETRLCDLEVAYDGDQSKKHLLLGSSLLEDDETNEEHCKLSKALKEKMKEYGDIALNYSRMSALKEPHARDHRSFFNYIVCKRPLAEPYRAYAYAKDDFFCAVDCQENYFEGRMRDFLWMCKDWPWIKRMFESKEETKANTDQGLNYYSSSRILIVARVLSVCLAVVVLLAPVYLLFLLPMSRGGMTITTTAFLVVFAGLMSFITGAKLEVVFIGTATYGALLITFLGNMSEGKTAFVP